jgi:hypothetical protein
MGAFIGGISVLVLVVAAIRFGTKGADRSREIAADMNKRTLDLLEDRNEIQREQSVTLGSIASALEEIELRGRKEEA